MGKKSSDPPPAPDYTGLAKQQGEENIKAAVISGYMSNPNVITPIGTQTVTWGNGTQAFDESAYNKAVDSYRQASSGGSGGGLWTDPDGNLLTSDQLPGGIRRHIESGNPTWYSDLYKPYSQQVSGVEYDAQGNPIRPNVSDFNYAGGNQYQATINQQLSPEEQAIFDTDQRTRYELGKTGEEGISRVRDAMATPFDMGQVHNIETSPTAGGMQSVADALMQRMQPSMDDRRRQTEEALLMQGHNRGGNAWGAKQNDLMRQENDAALASYLAAGQEQSRLYGMETDKRGRDISEQAYLRQLPLNEVNALRTGNQAMMPQFQAFQPTGVQPSPIMQAGTQQYAANMNNYNAQQASSSNMMNGLFGLGGTILGAPSTSILGGLIG